MEALKHNWFFSGFFKNRGYMDSAELTKYEIATIPKTPAMKEFLINSSQVFNGSGSKLEHGARLNTIGDFLQNNPFGLAVVAACTGMRGDSSEQLTRSRARAVAVRQYLVEKFKLDDLRIKTKGMGKQPQDAAGLADFVEILVYPAKPERSLRASK
jgi:outer membrane protein OmpA-like peptidoglycan-associated protein